MKRNIVSTAGFGVLALAAYRPPTQRTKEHAYPLRHVQILSGQPGKMQQSFDERRGVVKGPDLTQPKPTTSTKLSTSVPGLQKNPSQQKYDSLARSISYRRQVQHCTIR